MRTRFKPFVIVGAIGFAVQMAAFVLLTTVFDWRYEPATVMAIELAVVHNFWWHERWTWGDRPAGTGTLMRLCRFHIGTGCISILGGLAGTAWLVEYFHLNPIAANIGAVAFTSIGNFLVADRWVFLRHQQSPRPTTQMSQSPQRILARI